MKLSEILDAFRKAKPSELREAAPVLREALGAAERPLPPEPLSPEERETLAANLRQRRNALEGERAAAALEIAEVEKALEQANERARLAYARSADIDSAGYVAFRAEAWQKLWDGRPALVDALIAKTKHEAENLQPDAVRIPGEQGAPFTDGLAVGRIVSQYPNQRALVSPYEDVRISNLESLQVRQKGLRELVEAIVRWTKNGDFTTEAELSKLYGEAYRKLPVIEPVAETALRLVGDRAKPYVRRAPAPMPPAA